MAPRPIVTDNNATTGEKTSREMNDAEFMQYEKDMAAGAARELAAAAQATAKTALLKRMGLTADEAELLLS